MAKNYDGLAKTIIKDVGGKDNVISVVHCTTRLRFKLKDEKKANDDALKDTDGVVTVVKAGGKYQVVIGNEVANVYDAILKEGGFSGGGQVADDDLEDSNMSGQVENGSICHRPVFECILQYLKTNFFVGAWQKESN